MWSLNISDCQCFIHQSLTPWALWVFSDLSELWHWGVFLASLQRFDDLLLSSYLQSGFEPVCVYFESRVISRGCSWLRSRQVLSNYWWEPVLLCCRGLLTYSWTILNNNSDFKTFLVPGKYTMLHCWLLETSRPNFETLIIGTFYPGKIQQGCSSCTPSACIFNCCPLMPCGKILELWLSKKIFLTGCLQDRKSTRLNSSHRSESRMPSSAWQKKKKKKAEVAIE